MPCSGALSTREQCSLISRHSGFDASSDRTEREKRRGEKEREREMGEGDRERGGELERAEVRRERGERREEAEK